ncbi:MAG: HD domain-containing protein, partial [Actinobacteria bacterium]|nr:HD domain-containing protein [Actinomycetota bacterium]
MLVATFVVVVVPMLLVVWLRGSGVVGSVWAGMAIGVAVSLLASCAGGALWKARAHAGDIFFSDLMLWGWLQRWRSEHRLTAAADVLGLTPGRPTAISGGQLTNERKAGLLTRLTSGLEARDVYTHGHSRRVARHASNTARRMGLSRAEVAKIRAAGAMHDVGKVETPISVLRKEGK